MRAQIVLVGGGLANALLAWRLVEAAPDLRLLLLERGETLGGNHVWSFHGSDLTAAQRRWIAPLVERSWERHEVRFPGLRRRLEGSYHCLTSSRLDREIRARLGDRVLSGTEAVEVSPQEVRTGDGRTIRAGAVIDGRGLHSSAELTVAYQKFLGLHVELEEPSGTSEPILMDATVEQIDGYRFVYTLPFDERRLLIEDTRYSDTAELDRDRIRKQISDYASRQGWKIRVVLDEEEGVLPIVLAGDIAAFWAGKPEGIPCSGMRAALFHPTTGYSLAEAVRLADDLADNLAAGGRLESGALETTIQRRSRRVWKRGGFFRLLNRMLFRAAEPHERYRVLQRFYTLPEPLIERFYAGRPSLADRVRILTGKPPVPLVRALACILPGSASGPNPTSGSPRRDIL